ncbi:hypothetical protein D9M68_752620 [compost metagenome]
MRQRGQQRQRARSLEQGKRLPPPAQDHHAAARVLQHVGSFLVDAEHLVVIQVLQQVGAVFAPPPLQHRPARQIERVAQGQQAFQFNDARPQSVHAARH